MRSMRWRGLYLVGDGVERNPERSLAFFDRAIAAYPPGESRDHAVQQRTALVGVSRRNREAAERPAAGSEVSRRSRRLPKRKIPRRRSRNRQPPACGPQGALNRRAAEGG